MIVTYFVSVILYDKVLANDIGLLAIIQYIYLFDTHPRLLEYISTIRLSQHLTKQKQIKP